MDQTHFTTADESRPKKRWRASLTSGWMELTNIPSGGGAPEHIIAVASNLVYARSLLLLSLGLYFWTRKTEL